jgi:NhaA family Na+:H+ antiporter
VLAILGRSIPIGLRIFVAALAIVDDLLAVAVIALFYTGDLHIEALAMAGLVITALTLANLLGIRRPLVYAALGIALWLAVVESGIHAAVAGVALAMTIPAHRRIASKQFIDTSHALINEYANASTKAVHQRHSSLWELETLTKQAQAPMLRIEHTLTPWVAFAIVPLFALANAGVRLSGDTASMLAEPVALGIIVGLVIGKQVGITTAVWLIMRAGLASLPSGVTLRHVYGAAWVCGIGFTMSLFIGDLAYEGGDNLSIAKFGILIASVIAAAGGYLILRWLPGQDDKP